MAESLSMALAELLRKADAEPDLEFSSMCVNNTLDGERFPASIGVRPLGF